MYRMGTTARIQADAAATGMKAKLDDLRSLRVRASNDAGGRRAAPSAWRHQTGLAASRTAASGTSRRPRSPAPASPPTSAAKTTFAPATLSAAGSNTRWRPTPS
jgi:hypothetical protein